VQEQRQAGGPRADHGERGLRLRVATLEDGDQRIGQLVARSRRRRHLLSLAHEMSLKGGRGLRASPYRHLAEAGHQARSGQDLEFVGHLALYLPGMCG
jgi:hypothetical protein